MEVPFKLQRVIINRIYFNTFGVGFIFGVGVGGGGGVGGLKSGVFCCLLVDGPITFKWEEGGAYKRQFMVPGTFTYGYQLSCDYLYVVLLLAPYISLF